MTLPLLTKSTLPIEDAEAQLLRDAETGASIVRIQQEVAALELTLDLHTVMMVMIERAQGLAGASGGVIDLVDGEDLVCCAVSGKITRPVGGRLRLDMVEAAVSYVAVHEGKATLCEDTHNDSRVNQRLARQLGVRAMMVVPLRAADRVIGVIRMLSDRVNAFSARDLLNVQILVESFGATIQQHRIAAQWRASEVQYRLLFDHNPHPMWVTDQHTHALLAVNRAAVLHYGYSEQEFLAMHVSDLWLDEDADRWKATLRRDEHQQKVIGMKRRHRRKDGSVIDVEISADLVDFNGVPARLVLINDVTQRLRAERELARANRAQRMLSACNEVQIRASSEQVLLEEVCRITVEIGGYSIAWVGFCVDDEAKSILPVAQAGDDSGLLKNLNLSWSEERLAGRCRRPAHQAIDSGELVVVNDLAQESASESWVALGLRRGYRSVICLPLRNADRAFGVLGLYSKEAIQVGPEEAKLLQELANDLAFGIGSLRAQAEQRALQSAVLKVAAAVSASSGTAFFEQLVRNSAETLGAQAGLIARLAPGAIPAARSVAAVVNGAPIGTFEFALEGSPFARALHEGHSVEHGAEVGRFAAAWGGGMREARTCVWRRLDNSAGRPIGLIAVLFGEALQQSELMVSTLRIFATRAAAELERQESDARIRDQASLLDKAQDAIIVRSLEDRVLFWNRSAERLYGWTPEEAMGQSISGLLYDDLDVYHQAIRNVLALGEWSGEFSQHRKDGSSLTVEGRWTLVRDEYGNPESILAINTDITQRKVTELQIQKLAFFDPLTGLPNRIRLMDRLPHALTASTHSGHGGALLFIDLDNFRTLNDTLGHDKGDLLLQQVAQRLPACVREVDTVARLGGDEFVVMLEQLSANPHEVAMLARSVAEKVLAALNQPFDLAGYQHRATCSIGIAPFANTQESAGELLKHAELAMYQAKTAGRNTLRFFDPDMQEAVTARAILEGDLRQALAQN
ncbi:MAG TPA: diguanylate cyclase, partial [Burkholderiaceae bacterium]|nr:diguanylate cyclase [Burkholderiaceae bacterium]